MKDFKFKLVDLTFNFKAMPKHDQEYLRTMVFETIGERSVKSSGRSFDNVYSNANNFTLFNDHSAMINYMSEFTGKYESIASHLINGKKYYFAWTYSS
tara:strand:+ start:230 stop:523 length:294 start_codon:yes stop_codon:yes gene_type:complete